VSELETARRHRRDQQLLRAYAADPGPQRLADLVDRYQPLALSLAGRYRGRIESFDDLSQVANLGLVKAIKGFDPDRQLPFTAYAVPTILGEIRRHFRDQVWNLRLPRSLQEKTLKVEAALDGLSERLGRSPTVNELAAEAGLAPEEVNETLVARDARWTTSFDAPISEEDEGAVADYTGCIDPGFDQVEANEACARTALDQDERAAIEMRFGAGMTQAEIGKRLGCSQMQVSRISRRGLAKLLAAVQGDPKAPSAA
jgi:RNA polymerase sigma-B factor